MTDFAHLRVDAQDLCMALESRNQGEWSLDLETGEVLFRSADELCEDDADSPEASGQCLTICGLESFEAFRIMAEFVAELPEDGAQPRLEAALDHRKPFRTFKDTLLDFPALREAWFKYHDGRMLIRAQKWIEENCPGARLVQG